MKKAVKELENYLINEMYTEELFLQIFFVPKRFKKEKRRIYLLSNKVF